jgi:hypothetical protein
MTFLLFLLSLSLNPATPQVAASPAPACAPTGVVGSVSIYDGKVKFDLPSALTQQTQAQINTLIPDAAKRPDVLFASQNGTTKLSFVMKATPMPITPELLEQMRPMLAAQLSSSLENATILTNEMRTFGGKKCIYLDIKARRDGKDVRVFVVVTTLSDQLLVVNYGMPAAEVNDAKKREVLATFGSFQFRD